MHTKCSRMELAEHGSDAAAHYRLVARRTQRSPLCVVVRLAVRLAVEVEETATDERTAAVPAHETVRVPLRVQSRDVVLSDGVVAASALWGEQIEVVLPAVRFAIHLVVTLLSELGTTHAAEKVLRVPRLS